MKKLLAGCAFLFVCAFISVQSQAAGRLDFMLVNLTGQEMADVKICPTYYPQYLSENLLKAPLAPDSRIYIGPDYYGQQKNWDIKVKWANGHEQTFPNLLLTNYNCYTAYSAPDGVRMRQSYDPALANAEPFVPSYMLGNEVKVAVSEPEKVVVVNESGDRGEVGKAKGAQSTLIFEEGAKGAPILKDSQAEKATGETKALKTTVAVTRDGKTTMAQPGQQFKAGDMARLKYVANRDGNIYWLVEIAPGQYVVLYPSAQPNASSAITKNTEYAAPPKEGSGAKPGAERYLTIFADKPVPQMDKAVKLSREGKAAEASALVEELRKASDSKRASGEIFFEEEIDGTINTRSQKAAGDEPFVEEYELIFN